MRMRDWSSDVCSSDLTLTVLSSAQSGGAFASWHWLENAGLAAGAFEALVLSLGLADRSLQVRRERDEEIGRASCRERVCKYVEISVVAVAFKLKTIQHRYIYSRTDIVHNLDNP